MRKASTIWVISKYLASREYGFETRSVAIARVWAAEGRQPVIISSDSNHLAQFPRRPGPYTDEVLDGVLFRWMSVRRYQRTASVARVLSWLHFEWRVWRMDRNSLPAPDLIIVSSLSLFTVLNGLRLARRFGVPLAFEVRDIWPLTMIEYGGLSRWHPLAILMSAVERIGYRKADLVIGTMPNLGPHASRVAGRPVRTECIPFGVDPQLQGTSAADDGALSGEGDQLVVGYAGSMGVANALETLIGCIRALRGDLRFRFLLVGDGALRASYQEATADCRNVEWVGRVPREEVSAHLRRCDVLYFAAHPSRVLDSGMSPNKLMDYMLAGRPVIASYSGFQSMLNEAGCGEFIPAADREALLAALERYYAMPRKSLREMGLRGREWLFRNRTWGRLASEYAALLDELVESR